MDIVQNNQRINLEIAREKQISAHDEICELCISIILKRKRNRNSKRKVDQPLDVTADRTDD